jgi:hypothetical protein
MRIAIKRRAGFTFVELCLGLLVTTLVLGALASFTLAMASAWKHAEQSQSLHLRGQQTVLRLAEMLHRAKLLGPVRAGGLDDPATGAAVIFWSDDANRDGLIQGSEVRMIEHDIAASKLVLYSGTASETATWSYSSVFNNSAVLDEFKTNREPTALASNVHGAVFEASNTGSANSNPSLSFALKLRHDGTESTAQRLAIQYGTATLRAPLAQPGN